MDFSDGDTTKYARNPYDQFRKTHCKQKGKSDRHQAHNLRADFSHQTAKLDRWYKKVTTPKPSKPVKEKKAPINYGPIREARRIKAIPLQEQRVIKKRNKLNAYKRYTHWVARSLDEYNEMHPLIN